MLSSDCLIWRTRSAPYCVMFVYVMGVVASGKMCFFTMLTELRQLNNVLIGC